MRLLVCIDNRFVRARNGEIYSTTGCDRNFWNKYLQVFDEVVILARLEEIEEECLDKTPACGSNIKFFPVPYFIGPWQFLRNYYRLNTEVKKAIFEADAFLLHVPSTVCNVLWRHLRRKQIPYAVEVVGDPWESLASGAVNSFVGVIARRIARRNLKRQCQGAIAAAYRTEKTLQERYFAKCWQTHFSSVNLADSAIIDESVLKDRLNRTKAKLISNIPFRICYVGSLAQLYKGPDVLIDAISQCISENINLELFILGDGMYRKQLEKQAARLGLSDKVTFLGNVSPTEAVFAHLDQSDLFVLPSLTEGLPRALVEAMARGLPCISTPVGGIPELLESEDLVDPGNFEALASKIESVFNNVELLERMAWRNLKRARHFRADILNERRIEFHKKILEKTIEHYQS